MKLSVHLEKNSYPIYIEENILTKAGEYIGEVFSGRQVLIISDDNVYSLYGEALSRSLSTKYEVSQLVLPPGESTKSFKSLPLIYSTLINVKISRSDLIIALGGGVVGDLAGFAAATYLRGIKFIQIPTSLLAQVDSSIGGKVGVDLPQGKNLVGSFYQPKMVLIDPTVLNTLPERFINDGMGEVIKYGCIRDADLFQTLLSHSSFRSLKGDLASVIQRCVQIKQNIVEHDQFDTGERMLLNFGHTIGHTIEQYHNYKKESHGEAVGIGMYQITRLSEEQCLTIPGTADQILRLLKQYNIPYESGLPLHELKKTMALDKKNLDGHLHLILLREIGNAYVHPATIDFFKKDERYI